MNLVVELTLNIQPTVFGFGTSSSRIAAATWFGSKVNLNPESKMR